MSRRHQLITKMLSYLRKYYAKSGRIQYFTRSSQDKNKINNAAQKLKRLLNNLKYYYIPAHLQNLSATKYSDYPFWKATKRIKQPQIRIHPIRKRDHSWERSDIEKAETFASHPPGNPLDKADVHQSLDAPIQMYNSIQAFPPKQQRSLHKSEGSAAERENYVLRVNHILICVT